VVDEQQLATATAETRVWRIGFRPDPWAWSGWEWATDGRFPGRWDDLHGNFRTVYAGSSLRACLLEVLAAFRRDARLAMELDEIVEDLDGVTFASRHGDDLRLWAIFERPGDPHVSPKLTHARPEELHHNSEAIKDAFRMLGLTWRNE